MRNERFYGAAAILIGIAVLFGGCSSVQVRDRAYLQAMEINENEAVEVQLHDFQTEGVLAAGNGKNLDSALQSTSVQLGKELFLGHLELIACAAPSCTAMLSKWMEDYRLSPACKVLGLPQQITLEERDTLRLTEQLRRAENSGILPETSLFTILRELDGAGGTALMPVFDEEEFTAAIVTEDGFSDVLSEEAVTGLCWLRGENYPEQLAISADESYAVSYSAVRLYAKMNDGHAVVTAAVHLRGEGDFDKAAALVKSQCEAAVQETVENQQADVFDLEACLQSQCYEYVTTTPWNEVMEHLTVEVQVMERL